MTTCALAGKVAVVTGAASGIGRAIATRFVAEGARVVLADVDGAGVSRVASQLGDAARSVTADVAAPSDTARIVDAAADAFGSLDVLVNNAGIARYSPFLELPLAEWEEVQRVNVTGMFLVTQAAARRMLDPPPPAGATRAVINLSSVEGLAVVASSGHPQVHYNASKGAVHMLTRALAVELAPAIRVNSLCPGITETPLTDAARADPDRASYYLDRIPLRRFARPEDVAAAATFLASDDAGYVTGVALPVDGGWLTM